MANEIASIGIALETDSVSKGIASLGQLVQQGAKVEKAMAGVEGAATKTGKSLKTLGEGSAKGLDEVGKSAPKAADRVGRVARSAEDAKKALAGINASAAGLGQVSVAATQSARGMLGFGSSVQASKKSLIDMQAQVRAASTAVAQMSSAMTSALPSMQAAAKAQMDAAKNAADMTAAFRTAGEQMRSYGAAAQQTASASKEGAASIRNMAEASGGLNSNMRLAAQGGQAFLGLQVIGCPRCVGVRHQLRLGSILASRHCTRCYGGLSVDFLCRRVLCGTHRRLVHDDRRPFLDPASAG